MAEEKKPEEKKKDDKKESKMSPWSWIFVIAVGAIVIGTALPFLGLGAGQGLDNFGIGLESFSRHIQNAKAGIFTIVIVTAALGGAIALARHWNSKKKD